jgi:hypothetical protein
LKNTQNKKSPGTDFLGPGLVSLTMTCYAI